MDENQEVKTLVNNEVCNDKNHSHNFYHHEYNISGLLNLVGLSLVALAVFFLGFCFCEHHNHQEKTVVVCPCSKDCCPCNKDKDCCVKDKDCCVKDKDQWRKKDFCPKDKKLPPGSTKN